MLRAFAKAQNTQPRRLQTRVAAQCGHGIAGGLCTRLLHFQHGNPGAQQGFNIRRGAAISAQRILQDQHHGQGA
jgi:hypothetical protein